MNKEYYVYILASYKNGTLYVGVTNNLIRRVYEHKESFNKKSFTARYKVNKLVYYEILEDIYEAICREKYIKNLLRIKKVKLVEKFNPKWCDLYDDL